MTLRTRKNGGNKQTCHKARRKRTLNSCLPHTPEQEGQKSTFSLHPQFEYVESTKQKQQSIV